MTRAIGGETPVVDNSAPQVSQKAIAFQATDDGLNITKVVRCTDDRDVDLVNIMTAFELVVNAMGYDVELAATDDGDFIFYDNDLAVTLDEKIEPLATEEAAGQSEVDGDDRDKWGEEGPDYFQDAVLSPDKTFDLLVRVGARVKVTSNGKDFRVSFVGDEGVVVSETFGSTLPWTVHLDSLGATRGFDTSELTAIPPKVGDRVKVTRGDHKDAEEVLGYTGRVLKQGDVGLLFNDCGYDTYISLDKPGPHGLNDWYIHSSQLDVLVD
jgi:hypothetical protein